MAHMLENNPRAAYMDKPAWHGLGVVVAEQNLSIREFRQRAKMDYEAKTIPALYHDPITGAIVEAENQYHICRMDDGRIVSPSTVGKNYNVVTTDFMASLLEPLVEAGYARPDAMFTLRGGQVEVMTIRLVPLQDQSLTGDSSTYDSYGVIQNYHGGGSIKGTVVKRRAVCANTVPTFFDWKVRHTSSVQDRAKLAMETWEQIQVQTAKMDEAISIMASVPCRVPDTIDALLEIADRSKLTAQAERKRDEWIAASIKSPGAEGKTLLDVWHGATYLATHDTAGKGGKNQDMRIDSLFNGTRQRHLADTYKKLSAMAGV